MGDYVSGDVVEVAGGLILAAGYRTTFVATGMAVFTLATAVFFHNNFADRNQMIHFLKNIAMAGRLVQVSAFGAGSISIDALRPKRPARAARPAWNQHNTPAASATTMPAAVHSQDTCESL